MLVLEFLYDILNFFYAWTIFKFTDHIDFCDMLIKRRFLLLYSLLILTPQKPPQKHFKTINRVEGECKWKKSDIEIFVHICAQSTEVALELLSKDKNKDIFFYLFPIYIHIPSKSFDQVLWYYQTNMLQFRVLSNDWFSFVY